MKCLFAAVLCAFLVTHAGAASAPAARPNIVVILVDDMGIMDTSLPFLTDAAGQAKRYPLNDFYRTPNMERLAARGIRFNQFCAMSVCSPTRIAITKTPAHGLNDGGTRADRVADDQFARLLKSLANFFSARYFAGPGAAGAIS